VNRIWRKISVDAALRLALLFGVSERAVAGMNPDIAFDFN